MPTMAPISAANVLFISIFEAVIAFYSFSHKLPINTLTKTFSAFLALNSTIFFVYKLVIYPFFLSPFRHLPVPSKGFIPVLGHGLKMFQRPPGSAQLEFIKTVPNEGIINFQQFFHQDRLLLTKPSTLAEVLVHKSYDYEKPPWVRLFLEQYLGHGLLMTEGEEHKHQRKQIMPAFSFRHIKELYPLFWGKALELCDAMTADLWDKSEKVLDMTHYSTQVTLDIIGLAGLGRDICSLRNSDDELIETYEEILEPSAEKGIYFVLHLLFPQWLIHALPWGLNKRVKITAANLKRICTDFVEEKKARMKLEGQESVDILSIMMRSNNFSDQGLVDQLLTFLAAGHETTSSALTWVTYLLATDPAAQSRLRAEIHSAMPNPKDTIKPGFDIAGLLESLPYLNAVCNETLRLYPTIPVTARIATRDTSIHSTFVPKGTLCFVAPWATNRDPSLWGPDAEHFRPERWIDRLENGQDRVNYVGGAESNYSFLTFLHGPRSCIGEKFARAELRALVAVFVGRWEWEMADKEQRVRAGGTITSKPIGGMRVRLKAVNWAGSEGDVKSG